MWKRFRLCCLSSSVIAAPNANRGSDVEVIIGSQQVLGDDRIGEALATGGQKETLLQSLKGEKLVAMGLLQESEHQFTEGHPHRHIQGIHHEARIGISVSASEQVLPKDPPAPDQGTAGAGSGDGAGPAR